MSCIKILSTRNRGFDVGRALCGCFIFSAASRRPRLRRPTPRSLAALRDVSAERIQQTIEKLVSFGTRQTLSSDMPASSGKGR